MDLRTLLTAASLAAVLIPQTALADGDLLRCGGMEGPFAGGLAAGWVKNCYGSNEVVFAQETRDVHGGKAAERVTCTKFITGCAGPATFVLRGFGQNLLASLELP